MIMVIKIRKDILTNAIDNSEFDQNEYANFLHSMADCALKGKHVVYVPSLKDDKVLAEELKGCLSNRDILLLSYAAKRSQEIKHILSLVTVYAVVSGKIPDVDEKHNILHIDIHTDSKLECATETFLLTENLIDSDFFEFVRYHYQRKNFIKNCLCTYYPLMGGGATTGTVFEREVKRMQHFCLALTDGDKKYKGDDFHETAQSVKNVHRKNKSKKAYFADCYSMSLVSEIENLVPKKVVLKCSSQIGYPEIFDKDPSYYDMKLGLLPAILYNDKSLKYWECVIDEQNLFDEVKSLRNQSPNKNSYDVSVQNIPALKPGFGVDLLKRCIEKNKNCKTGVVLNDKFDLCRVVDGDLTNSQKKEWENIGRLIFSWTCAMKAKIN